MMDVFVLTLLTLKFKQVQFYYLLVFPNLLESGKQCRRRSEAETTLFARACLTNTKGKYNLGLAVLKHIFEHMGTTKTQFSLRIPAV